MKTEKKSAKVSGLSSITAAIDSAVLELPLSQLPAEPTPDPEIVVPLDIKEVAIEYPQPKPETTYKWGSVMITGEYQALEKGELIPGMRRFRLEQQVIIDTGIKSWTEKRSCFQNFKVDHCIRFQIEAGCCLSETLPNSRILRKDVTYSWEFLKKTMHPLFITNEMGQYGEIFDHRSMKFEPVIKTFRLGTVYDSDYVMKYDVTKTIRYRNARAEWFKAKLEAYGAGKSAITRDVILPQEITQNVMESVCNVPV